MADFAMTRSATIDAPADRIHLHLDDFHEWQQWSPWEGLDPDLRRTFTGPDQGVGAHYAWAGNSRAGAGSMEIIGSSPHQVRVALEFSKPIRASNVITFDLVQAGAGATRVDWTMSGRRGLLMTVAGRLFFDRSVGKDFDRGLAQLKSVSEAR